MQAPTASPAHLLHQGKRCSPCSSENCTSPPSHQGTLSFSQDPGPQEKAKGKLPPHPFAITGQQHWQLPSALPFLKHDTWTRMKNRREGEIKTKSKARGGNKNKNQGSRAVKSHVDIPALEGAVLLSCRASHSSREYLAHGDTFLCQHPAKVAPRSDYPTRAGHGRRRSLPALPCQGQGCLPPLQGTRAAAAAPQLLGDFQEVPSYPGAWGK